MNAVSDGLVQSVYPGSLPTGSFTSILDQVVTFQPALYAIVGGVSTTRDGVYTIDYLPTAVGYVKTELSIRGQYITGSPFYRQLSSGGVSAELSFAQGPGLQGVAPGTETFFLIFPRDIANLPSTDATLALSFSVVITGVADVYINQFGPVWSAANAAYLFRYTVTKASTLSIAITFTPAAGVATPIYGSAFSGIEVVEVQPGSVAAAVDPARCTATGPALSAMVAGQITAAVVNLYDTTGRLTTAPAGTVAGNYFKCSVTDKTGAVQFAASTTVGFYTDVAMTTQGLNPADFGFTVPGGSFFCAFTPTATLLSPYTIKFFIKVNGADVQVGSSTGTGDLADSHDFTVIAGPTDVAVTQVTIGESTSYSVVAGEPAKITIIPRDSFLNPQDYIANDPDTFELYMSGPTVLSCTELLGSLAIVRDPRGFSYFEGAVTPTVTGTYSGNVRHVSAAGVITKVFPALSLVVLPVGPATYHSPRHRFQTLVS